MPPVRSRARKKPVAATGGAGRQKEIQDKSEEGTPIPSSPGRSPSREREAEAKPPLSPPPAESEPQPTTAALPAREPHVLVKAEPVDEEKPVQPAVPSASLQPHVSPARLRQEEPSSAQNRLPPRPATVRPSARGKPRLNYNPFSDASWGLDKVDTHSPGYREAYHRLLHHFPRWLHSIAVHGERLLREVRTNVERRAVVDMARQFGYEPTNPRKTSCKFVFVEATNKLFLRSGPGNPHLGEEMARELSRMEIEFRRFVAHRDGKPEPITPIAGEQGSRRSSRGRDGMVLHWDFTDLYVHRDVIEVLRLLAFDIGVFRGRPSPSATELIACYDVVDSVIEADFIYPVDVALEYNPRWAEEMDYICRLPGKDGKPGVVPYSPEDPYPPSEMIRHHPEALHHYRRYIRPFMFNWNPTSTRCETGMKMAGGRPPPLAVQLGTAFSLRWDKDESGNVFLRRWLRHTLSLFAEFSPSLRRQDEQTVSLVMRELQRRRPELSLVDLLKQAKEVTPHFGMLNLCLNFSHFRRELGELQAFAGKAGFFVYMRQEEDDVYVAATARDFPVLRAQEFTPIFQPTGSCVAPSYLIPHNADIKPGNGKEPAPSMQHLISRFATRAPADDEDDGRRQPREERGRHRSRSRSRSPDKDDGRGASRRQRRHSEERGPDAAAGQPQAQSQQQPQPQPPVPTQGTPVQHATPPVAMAYPQPPVPSYPPQPPQHQAPQQQQQPAPMMMVPGYASQAPLPVPMGYPVPAAVAAATPGAASGPYSYPLPPMAGPPLPQGVAPYSAIPHQQPQAASSLPTPRRSPYLYPGSLPAASLYDAVAGAVQRQFPIGQTVDTRVVEWRAPGGGMNGSHSVPAGPPVPVTFVLDHVKREAFVTLPIPR